MVWPGGRVKQHITGQNILATGGLMLRLVLLPARLAPKEKVLRDCADASFAAERTADPVQAPAPNIAGLRRLAAQPV